MSGIDNGRMVLIAAGSPMLTANPLSFPRGINFKGCNIEVVSAIRVMPANWRPLPQLRPENVDKVFPGRNVLPLSVAILPHLNEHGQLALSATDTDSSAQERVCPDTWIMFVFGQADDIELESVANEFAVELFAWLRVLTSQFWLGRSWDVKSDIIASFPATKNQGYAVNFNDNSINSPWFQVPSRLRTH